MFIYDFNYLRLLCINSLSLRNLLSRPLLISFRSCVCCFESSFISVNRLKAETNPSFEITWSSSIDSFSMFSASWLVIPCSSKFFLSSLPKYSKFLRCKTGLCSCLNLIRQSGDIMFSIILNSQLMLLLSLPVSWPDLSNSLWIPSNSVQCWELFMQVSFQFFQVFQWLLDYFLALL